jgi:hypothetical protein
MTDSTIAKNFAAMAPAGSRTWRCRASIFRRGSDAVGTLRGLPAMVRGPRLSVAAHSCVEKRVRAWDAKL